MWPGPTEARRLTARRRPLGHAQEDDASAYPDDFDTDHARTTSTARSWPPSAWASKVRFGHLRWKLVAEESLYEVLNVAPSLHPGGIRHAWRRILRVHRPWRRFSRHHRRRCRRGAVELGAASRPHHDCDLERAHTDGRRSGRGRSLRADRRESGRLGCRSRLQTGWRISPPPAASIQPRRRRWSASCSVGRCGARLDRHVEHVELGVMLPGSAFARQWCSGRPRLVGSRSSVHTAGPSGVQRCRCVRCGRLSARWRAHGVEAVELQRRTDVVLGGLFDQLRRGAPAEAESARADRRRGPPARGHAGAVLVAEVEAVGQEHQVGRPAVAADV